MWCTNNCLVHASSPAVSKAIRDGLREEFYSARWAARRDELGPLSPREVRNLPMSEDEARLFEKYMVCFVHAMFRH